MDLIVNQLNTCMIHLYIRGGHTMGDTLMAMCLFNSLNQPVHITTVPNSWYVWWKNIFNIGDQITLDLNQNFGDWNSGEDLDLESFKIFSRYDQFSHVNLFGKLFPISSQRKKLAAVLISDGGYAHTNDFKFFSNLYPQDGDPYPFIKFHSKETYNCILDLVQSAGYDPIIIDSKDISVEHKVFILNELCDFVIGYEGGICHLAHALKIPAIILPWRVNDSKNITDFLHLDKRTYFIRQAEDLKSWSATDLKHTVNNLHNELGYNNHWMIDPEFPNPSKFLEYFRKGSEVKFSNQVDWALRYIENPTLGGY